jgi:hypothetical protein
MSETYSYLQTQQLYFIVVITDNYVVLVRERSVPTARPLLVGEVSANFCG